jgi:hypothetical protein
MKHPCLFVFVTGILGCSEVVPGSCYPNPAGGAGGADSVTVGVGVGATTSGDFISPPPGGPLDYGGEPNPCIEPQGPCNEKCLADYEAAAGECGKIQDDAQRRTCQDSAHASYQSCRGSCSQQLNADCDEKYQYCLNYAPTSCLAREGGKTLCQRCLERCRAGDSPSDRCRKCGF